MSAPDFLAGALASTMPSLSGGETVTIESETIPAVLDPTSEGDDLVLGGEGDHRTLSLLVASADLPARLPLKGDGVQARGLEWIIASLEYHPLTTTRLNLESPARRL
jgi:hypothetical protein